MKITPIPSDKIVLLVRYFHLSLGIFLLITALFLNGCSSGNVDSAVRLSWKNTSKAPKSLLQLAISENTSLPSTQVNLIKVATIPTTEKDKHLSISTTILTYAGSWGVCIQLISIKVRGITVA